ncbi:MAG: alpha/beta fold hydrolase [Bacteroidota bacterium]
MSSQTKVDFKGKTINFTATDGLKVTADLYMTDNKSAPLIILYHQAGFSRGEYRTIAPKLNALGFHCLALDQRSGKEVNGIKNETKREAVKQRKGTQYTDAIPDIEGGLLYAKNTLNAKTIIVWGSSYSAALVFYLANKYPEDIKGVLAFSPGEYFKVNGKTIKTYASKVRCPVFMTSSKREHKQWKGIYEAVQSDRHFYLPKDKGYHGSRALWPVHKGHEEGWKAVSKFLALLK